MSFNGLHRWDEYRPECLKIALILALASTNIIINLTTELNLDEDYIVEPMYEDPFVQIPRTIEKKEVVVKPPKIENASELVVEEPEFLDETEVEQKEESNSTNQETHIEDNFTNETLAPEPAPKIEPIIIEEEEEELFLFAEHMPVFGDCLDQLDDEAEKRKCTSESLQRFVYSKLKYPKIAIENGIQGTVVAEFVVSKSGEVKDLKIIRKIGGGCDERVYDILSKMPIWRPGKQNGRPVNVIYKMPVKFKLK